MPIAYLDCFSGASGDMLLGALIDAGVSADDLRRDLARLPLADYELRAERVTKCGIVATKVTVEAGSSHAHRGLHDILAVIGQAELPEPVKETAARVFTRLGEAEAKVHGTSVEQVHFHEVGAVDAIVDVVGTCCGLHRLGITEAYASALPLGGGWVESAHGRFPVPAPATAELLRAVPTYGGPVEAELVTPTGAAIVTTICRRFGTMPPMAVQAIGCGAGGRDLPHPNVLRVFIGEATAALSEPVQGPEGPSPLRCSRGDPELVEGSGSEGQRLAVIETNLDDMNPEFFDHLMERLFGAGALDVYYTPIVMKKSRPATLVSVLAEPGLVSALSDILFRETTTLGLRVMEVVRRCLAREWREVETPYGRVRVKVGLMGSEVVTSAPEYEDCRRLAQERGVPVKAVYDAAKAACEQER